MNCRAFRRPLIAVAIAAQFAWSLSIPDASAQKKVFWDPPPATIVRVAKPNREPQHPLPRTEKASPLTLQWRLFQRTGDDGQVEADPTSVFRTGDRLRLAITTNQSGFLYIVHQMEGEDGHVLFPDPTVNGGNNTVKKNQEYAVPKTCSNIEDPNDCWMKMDETPGLENLVVIFSRDKITTLPNQAVEAYGEVKESVIEKLKSDSRQKITQVTGKLSPLPGQAKSKYATRVQNTNTNDNEELITTIQLKHGDR